jgi:hypothetical protein
MYISRLVKTRDLYPGLLQLPFCLPHSLAAYLYFSSSSLHLSHLFSHLSSLVHLLLVNLSGSAVMPSHIQRGPSVTIPSV